MNYQKIIDTASEIIKNDNIYKNGLILTYQLDEDKHNRMNEELFYRNNPLNEVFVKSDEYEIEVGGIIIKFVKK